MYFCFRQFVFNQCELEQDKAALLYPGGQVSWVELLNNTWRVREELQFVNPECLPLMIMGHKQPEYVYYVLACLQLSIPYVPLDSIYPGERINAIKQQLGQGLLVDLDAGFITPFNTGRLEIEAESNNPLAYVLFTSGSTGLPKGVKIHQRSLQDLYQWVCKAFPFNERSVVLSPSLFTFDVSLLDIMGSIGQGGTLQLVDREVLKKPEKFLAYLAAGNCSDWVSTPSFVSRWLLSRSFNHSNFPALKHFILAGEALPAMLAKKLNERFSDGCTYNAYGPTEATVVVTLGKITQQVIAENGDALPLGSIKPSGRVFTLDERNVAGEAYGEIVIAGDNVSSGYLNKQLAANSNFFTYEGLAAYKTGDYGFIRNGELFYGGRKDELIKLNGYRIELMEIESVISQQAEVTACSVLVLYKNERPSRLIAFVFVEKEALIKSVCTPLRSMLNARLPSYMVPSELLFDISKNIPSTASYKIDKKRLMERYVAAQQKKADVKNTVSC